MRNLSFFSIKKTIHNYTAPVLAVTLLIAGTSIAQASDIQQSDEFPPAPTENAPTVTQQLVQPQQSGYNVCNSTLVRSMAKERFTRQMTDIPNQTKMSIVSFSNVIETQYVKGAESYDIDRRYCSASVTMTNGQTYPATYVVERNQGFAGIGGRHVSFCVEGLDKWLIRDNDCRSLRAPVNSLY